MATIRLLGLLLLHVAGIQGHIRWVCPRPESPSSAIKEGPCGARSRGSERVYMDIVPGPMTIQYEETRVHPGYPIRISLMEDDSDRKHCLLLDHVPHNDDAQTDINENCRLNDYPIGRCNNTNYITVNIPDIECERCYLQIISIATHRGETCKQRNPSSNNCTAYYSCAPVRIRPTKTGSGRSLWFCMDYQRNLKGTWPYMQRQNYYQQHGISFTKGGWPNNTNLIGLNAIYPQAVNPEGPCAPKTWYFGASLEPRTKGRSQSRGHGTIGMIITDSRMRMLGTFVGIASAVTNITLMTTSGASVDIPQASISAYRVNVTMDISPIFQQLINGEDVKVLFKTTNEPTGELEGVLEQAILATITAEAGHSGSFVFEPLRDGGIRYSFTLLNVWASDTVLIRGPGRRGMEAPALFDIMKLSSVMEIHGHVHGHGIWRNITSDVYMYLWAGLLSIDARTFGQQGNGQLTVPGDWFCKKHGFRNVCPMTYLSVDDQGTDRGLREVPTNGIATFHLDSRQNFHFSILIRDVIKGETVRSVEICKGRAIVKSIDRRHIRRSNIEDRVFNASGSIDGVSDSFLRSLSAGTLVVRVSTTRFPGGRIQGTIPPIETNRCIIKQNMQIDWSSPPAGVSVTSGDSITINYGGSDTVELLPDQESFYRCEFKGAKVIGRKQRYQTKYNTTSPGTFYLASRAGCSDFPPRKMAVSVKASRSNVMSPRECSRTLYDFVVRTKGQALSSSNTLHPVSASTILFHVAILAGLLSWL